MPFPFVININRMNESQNYGELDLLNVNSLPTFYKLQQNKNDDARVNH